MLYVMKEMNPKISDPIKIFEDFLGKELPRDYRLFLEQTNGGIPFRKYFLFKDSEVNILLGITDNDYNSLIKHYNKYKNIVPSCMIPIGNDQGGNMILLSISGNSYGSIYFLDHEKAALIVLKNSSTTLKAKRK